VDWEAVANEVVDAVMKQMNAIGQGLIDFGGALGEIGANGANRVLEAVKDVDVQGAAESVSGAASSSVKATGKAVGSITKGAGKAIGSMADGAGRALDATTDALKGAGGAIKELIGK
jgi:hypothetical protein